MNNKISIVTVTYNCVSLLEETIKSVILQDYAPLEYIIIDGGSTDGTIEVVKKYSDYVDVFVSEPDRGIFDAMNKGIKKATGEWINFMNAGDRFANSTVLSHVFKNNSMAENADVIFGDMITDNRGMTKEIVLVPFYEKTGIRGMGFSHQSVFVKTQKAKRYPFDLNYRLSADYNMIWKLYYNDHAIFHKVDFPICCMLGGEGATQANYKEHLVEVCRVCEGSKVERLWFIYSHIVLRLMRILKRNLLNR